MGHAGRARDGDGREAVGREDLLHVVAGDDAARCCAGRAHRPSLVFAPLRRAQSHHGCPVRRLDRALARRVWAAACLAWARRHAQETDEVRTRITFRGNRASTTRGLCLPLSHVIADAGSSALLRSTSSISSSRSSSSALIFSPRSELAGAAGSTFCLGLGGPRPPALPLLFLFCHRSRAPVLWCVRSSPMSSAGRPGPLVLCSAPGDRRWCLGCSLEGVHHRDAPQRVCADVEDEGIPVGGHDGLGPARQALAPGPATGVRSGARRPHAPPGRGRPTSVRMSRRRKTDLSGRSG